jgi:hypothetical protein
MVIQKGSVEDQNPDLLAGAGTYCTTLLKIRKSIFNKLRDKNY